MTRGDTAMAMDGGSDDKLEAMVSILMDIRKHTRLLYVLAWIGIIWGALGVVLFILNLS
jgi:hypothetical protein